VLIGSFVGLALRLSAIGVYRVMAFLTTAREREIAIRVALGATRIDVVGLVVRDAMKLAAAGTVICVVATPLAFRILSAAVFEAGAWNPVMLAAVAAGLAALCAAAAAIPALRTQSRSTASPMR
jgi:putative ABC transport system permease protein